MKRTTLAWGLVATLAAGVGVIAQQGGQPPAPPQIANPSQTCNLTPAQIAEGRKVALAFFTSQGPDRIALADPTYKQHNPAFKKRAEEAGISDFQEFQNAFNPPNRAGGAGGGGGQGGGARQGGPGGGGPNAAQGTPPGPNNQFDVVTTECDITVAIHRNWRPDPATPGRWYEAYTFDAFRVRNGKLVEHWDTAVINPPAAGGQGGPGGGAPGGGAPARGN